MSKETNEFKRHLTEGPDYAKPDDVIQWQNDFIEKVMKNWQNHLINNECPHCKELGNLIKKHVSDRDWKEIRRYMNRVKNP